MSEEAIREAFERNAKAVALRPAISQRTARTKVRLKPGLECEVEEGAWKLTVGMSGKSGGTNAGPDPAVFGRAALGSCLALGYALWAARLNVAIDAVDVEIEADYDSRGQLGVSDDVPPGCTQVRYIVKVVSAAPEEDVRRVIESADRHSHVLDIWLRAHDVRRDLRIVATA